MSNREYNFGPERIAIETDFGPLMVKAVGGNKLRVEVGDQFLVRGVHVAGSIFLTRLDDGTWEQEHEHFYRHDRVEISRPLRRTLTEAAERASLMFFEEHPDLLHQAALAEINNDIYHKAKTADKLRQQLADLDEEIGDLLRIEEGLTSAASTPAPRL